MVKSTLKYDYPAVPVGEPFTIRVMLGLGGDGSENLRVPLNLGLVLDRSGSMRGEKLDKAVESALMITGMLQSDEHLTIAAFDSNPELILPVTKGPELKAVELALSRIKAGSMTNMGSGCTMAKDQVKSAVGNNVSRLIVLSDGLVNEGMGHRQLAELAELYRQNGLTISTFGVGADFDENLMTMMAERK